MRVGDESLAELEHEGVTIVPGFLSPDEVALAQAGLWTMFPRPDDYFADPSQHSAFGSSQFAGLRRFPTPSWDLNRIAFHPDLVDAAERFLRTEDVELYKVEIWAKYSGAIDYDQPHHRDFGNHSIVVPRVDGTRRQLTTFILLSDVTDRDGPTAVVPLSRSRGIEMVPENQVPGHSNSVLDDGELRANEVLVTGSAGTLMMYRTDVLHRATGFTAPGRSRFAVLADYQERGASWMGKMAWPDYALRPGWTEAMERASVRERDLFGFPPPGSPYWDEQTLRDVGRRYPNMDMTPYGS